jgi:hypothetical protein
MRSNFFQQVTTVKSQLTGEALQSLMARHAIEQRDKAIEHNRQILGRAPAYQTFVDGRQTTALKTVSPGGTILFVFDVGGTLLQKAADELYGMLVYFSPVLTGQYQKSHRLFVNGIERDAATEARAGARGVIEFMPNDVISFVNLLPYARKIEKGSSDQAPNGVYETAFTALRAKYGNQLKMNFTYDPYPGYEVGTARRGGSNQSQADIRRSRLYPTITFSLR